MVDIPGLIAAENQRWQKMVVQDSRMSAFTRTAQRLVAAKSRYAALEAKTRVPWFAIAVIHEREASQNFLCSIAQGDPWAKKSVHVPIGRGPFTSFEEAAVDALVNCAPKAARWTDWSAGGSLTILEMYNGLGYAMRGIPSPYVWAGTNQYTKGKYVRDGKFDPEQVDTQLGVAGLLKAMQVLDPSITFGSTLSQPPVARLGPAHQAIPVVPAPSLVPSVTHPAAGSIGSFIAGLLHH